MNSKKSGQFVPSDYSANNSYSVVYKDQWIEGYEDGYCQVRSFNASEDSQVEYL